MRTNRIDLDKVFGDNNHQIVTKDSVVIDKIPIEVLKPAVEKTKKKFGKGPDKWKKEQEMYCKQLCGPDYDHFEEGEFRVQYVDWRKEQTGSKRGQLPPPELSEEYKAHLKTPEHIWMVRIVIAEADGMCCGCSAPATECHHRRYRPETWGTPEEKKDMTAVCRRCHKVLDKRRNAEAGRVERK